MICGVDTETTGLKIGEDRVIEIGAVLFDDRWNVVDAASWFILHPGLPPLTEEIQRLTHISDEMLSQEGIPLEEALRGFLEFSSGASHYVAHNAQYDLQMLGHELKRVGKLDAVGTSPENWKKPWICTAQHVPHPEWASCFRLSHLALDYGVAVNPNEQHRAIPDILLMGKMLAAGGHTLETIQAHMAIPWVYLQAVTQVPWKDGGKSNEIAKKHGFKYEKVYHSDPKVFPKTWVKKVKADKVEAEKAKVPLPITILKE